MAPKRVLVVDDEPAIRELLSEMLLEDGYTVDTAGSGREALEKSAVSPPDVYLVDFRLPDLTGMELIERLDLKAHPAEAIVVSGERQLDLVRQAMERGVFTYITKPFQLDELRAKVGQAYSVSQWKRRRMEYTAQMEQLRSFILTIVAHELRTPLTIFSNLLSVLDNSGPGSSGPLLETVLPELRGAHTRMAGIVSDIIDISKVSDTFAPVVPGEVDVMGLLRDQAKALHHQVVAKGVILEMSAGFHPPLWETDGELLRMAARCLLSNAVKFNRDKGRVRVEVRREGEKSSARLILSVSDEGSGVDPGVAEILSRPSSGDERLWLCQRGGMGVGLFVLLRVADLLRGKASAEGRPGGGAVFSLAIPRLPAAA